MKSIARSEFAERLAAGEAPETIFPEGLAKFVSDAPPVSASDVSHLTINNVILTNGTVDRFNDSLAPRGAQYKNFLKNSVLQWAHDSSIPAIGRVANLRTTSNDVRGSLVFAPSEIYPLAGTIFNLMKGGFLNAVSIGLIPMKAMPTKDKNRPGGLDITEFEIIELSVCNVPANPDCLVQARSVGVDTAPLIGWAEKVLDTGGLQMIPREELQALRRAAGAPATSASSAAAIADRRREARQLTAKARSIVASMPDPEPMTRAQRLAEARAFRHIAMAPVK
jgi:HK97 family phage prohead protease